MLILDLDRVPLLKNGFKRYDDDAADRTVSLRIEVNGLPPVLSGRINDAGWEIRGCWWSDERHCYFLVISPGYDLLHPEMAAALAC